MTDAGVGNKKSSSRGTPLRRDDLVCEELDDEAVLFDPRLGSVHRFNAMTLFIWQRCDGAHAAHAMAEAVARRYAIDTQQALLHVERVVSEFDELGLLDDSPGAPDPGPWRGPTRRAPPPSACGRRLNCGLTDRRSRLGFCPATRLSGVTRVPKGAGE